MAPGVSGEVGKVASGMLDVVKGQPMILALILFNLMFAILVFMGSKDFRANQLKLMSMMIDMTAKSQQLLAECVVPQTRGELAPEFVPLPLPRPVMETENK